MLGRQPLDDVAVPPLVLELAAGRRLQPVWVNELGGVTFSVGDGTERTFLKWSAAGDEPDLAAEADRMRWVRRYSTVPQVVALHDDTEGSVLVTSALPGDNAVSATWAANPATAVHAIGVGLRSLHERAPVDGCPYSWSVADRVASARVRVAAGATAPPLWHSEHQGLSERRALQILGDPPPVDRLVVCHGDACAPNTILDDDGRWAGHVDLGALGIADRWADLAIATWSAGWNYGPGWQDVLLDAYGVEPDHERTAYYRLLWDLS